MVKAFSLSGFPYPHVSGRPMRLLDINSELPPRIDVRKKLNAETIMSKLGIKNHGTLSQLGIDLQSREIDMGKLAAAVKADPDILAGMYVRKGEQRPPEHLARVAAARIGEEKDVLNINIVKTVKRHAEKNNAVAMMVLVWAARRLYPETSKQISFIASVISQISSEFNDHCLYMLLVAREIHPDNIAKQGAFVVLGVREFYDYYSRQNEFVFTAAQITSFYTGAQQGVFVASAAEELYCSSLFKFLSNRDECVTSAIKGMIFNSQAEKNAFKCSAAQTLYPDNVALQARFLSSFVSLEDIYPYRGDEPVKHRCRL